MMMLVDYILCVIIVIIAMRLIGAASASLMMMPVYSIHITTYKMMTRLLYVFFCYEDEAMLTMIWQGRIKVCAMEYIAMNYIPGLAVLLNERDAYGAQCTDWLHYAHIGHVW